MNTNTTSSKQINRNQLAIDFIGNVLESVGSNADEMRARNAAELDSAICHSHDLCDANQCMLDALAVQGKTLHLGDEADQHRESKAISEAVDFAWATAKRCAFDVARVKETENNDESILFSKESILASYGYGIAPRDPLVNPSFDGRSELPVEYITTNRTETGYAVARMTQNKHGQHEQANTGDFYQELSDAIRNAIAASKADNIPYVSTELLEQFKPKLNSVSDHESNSFKDIETRISQAFADGEQNAPLTNAYDKGCQDTLESFVLAAQATTGQAMTARLTANLVETVLDAHANNAPDEEDLEQQGATQKSSLIHAAYLALGFREAKKNDDALSEKFGGHIGVMNFVSSHATNISTALTSADELGYDYPDVFDYQVTQAMGQWLGEHMHEANIDFNAELVTRMEVFFGEDCAAVAEQLRERYPRDKGPRNDSESDPSP